MKGRAQTENLHPLQTKGYYIYKQKHRASKYLATRKWDAVHQKSAIFYSYEEALAWLDSLPPEYVGIQYEPSIFTMVDGMSLQAAE